MRNKEAEKEKNKPKSPGLKNSLFSELFKAGRSDDKDKDKDNEGEKEERQGEEKDKTFYHTPEAKTDMKNNLPEDESDIFNDARKKIGLWPVKLRHYCLQ